MALPAIPSLPTPPTMQGADDKARQEYFDALQKTLDALDARANRGPNWFQLAGAFLDPGRTGNVGEAVGRAATMLGEQQQRQADMALPIAQVRAQLAGQKYEVANQGEALKLLGRTLGVDPNAAIAQLNAGQLSQDQLTRLAQIYPAVAQLSPKVGEILKSTFGLGKDITELDVKRQQLKLDQERHVAQMAQADRTAGMSQADLVAKYGPGVLSLLPGGPMQPRVPAVPGTGAPAATPTPGAGVTPQPAGQSGASASPMGPQPATSDAAVLPVLDRVQQLRRLIATSQDPTLVANARDELQKAEAELRTRFNITLPPMPTAAAQPTAAQPATMQPAAGAPARPTGATPQTPSDLRDLPLSTQAEVAKRRVEERDKPYNAKRDEVLSYTPQMLEGSNTNLRQLDQIARQYPQIFALMQQQGVMSGLLTAAQEGAQAQAGTYTARLGLPVQQFLERVKLKPEEQQAVRDVGRILGTEFLNNVKANKGLLGINPTDNDARLLQAPMASIQDSAKAVQYWSRNQLLLNKQREALYGALSDYQTSQPAGSSISGFFSPKSEYGRINAEYAKLRMELFRQFYPDTPR